MPRLEGSLLTEPSYFERIKNLVEDGIGGFILFGGKYQDVKKAIRELQEMSETHLFIAADLEQGLGQQIEGGTLFPNAMAIASAIDSNVPEDMGLLREAIRVIAFEARDVGINIILAPVLDVNTNPENPIICTRSFSDDPLKVSLFGKEFIDGIQSLGLIACAKHFPGHGGTEIDSHIELPVIKSSKERLMRFELYPFIESIKTGVRMIMVGHLKADAIDPDIPASLSYKVINDLLRKELGFNGMVITDAMNMGAIKSIYNENSACLMAFKAGADIILHPENPESVLEGLLSRWKEIELQVEESFKRILKAKERFASNPPPSPFAKGGISGGLKIPEVLSEKAIRIMKGKPKISEDSIALILDDDATGAGNDFIEIIKMKYPSIESIYIDSKNVLSEKNKAFEKIKNRPLVVGIFSKISALKGRSGIHSELLKFLKDALIESGNSTVISFGSPYLLDPFRHRAGTLIVAYWGSDTAQRAVANLVCKGAG